MKKLKLFIGVILVATCAAIPQAARADNSTNAPVKPYPLKTCLVCGMELGMMGQPYVFTNAKPGNQTVQTSPRRRTSTKIRTNT